LNGGHLISVRDLSLEHALMLTAPFKRQPTCAPCAPQRGSVNLLFQQPSLRTASSFSAAAVHLGLTPVLLSTGGSALRDRCELHDELVQLSHLGRAVIVRSTQSLAGTDLSRMACPVVNAGDGDNEHPSQALLDLTTLRTLGLGALGSERSTVLLMGNLKEHRVNHSLYVLLRTLSVHFGLHLVCIRPPGLGMPERYLDVPEGLASSRHFEFRGPRDVDAVMSEADFVYLSPLPAWTSPLAPALPAFSLNLARAKAVLQPHAKILHPFPRHGELGWDLDGSPFDGYRLQTSLGPAVRARLLAHLLDAWR
jgi:aspartate carbamoyltransferase catalytic subunit